MHCWMSNGMSCHVNTCHVMSFILDLFPEFEENHQYQVRLYPRRAEHYSTSRPIPRPNGDEAHIRNQDFDAVSDGIAALGLQVVAGPLRVPRSSGLSSRRYYITRRGPNNPAVDSDVDTSTESLSVVSGRVNYGPYMDSLLSSGEVEDWHTTSQPLSPALPVDAEPERDTPRPPSPEFEVPINNTITSFVTHLSDGTNSLDCTANRNVSNGDSREQLDTTRGSSLLQEDVVVPPECAVTCHCDELPPSLPGGITRPTPYQRLHGLHLPSEEWIEENVITSDLGPATDVDIEVARDLLTAAMEPDSPPSSTSPLTPLPPDYVKTNITSPSTELKESIASFKRQLSSVTTLSNDSTKSQNSLPNMSGLEDIDEINQDSRSRKPQTKRRK